MGRMDTTPRVLVIYTGGTIGMKEGPRGWAPAPGHLAERLASMPLFHDRSMPALTTPVSRYGRRIRYDILEYDPLLDSSNMDTGDWVKIARDIERNYDAYDAFVVLHGTDTMAYTASALSFMLENLGKTVVLTGSQIPIGEARSDAIDNVLGALTIAGHFEIPEVCLYFANRLMRGNRTRKVDASGFAAFQSANCAPLADVGIDVRIDWERVLVPTKRPFTVRPITNRNVAALRLFPGISAEMLRNVLKPPTQGLVLESFGSGNAPDRRQDFLDALREGTERGVVILNVTQCHHGAVKPDYAAGRALADAGVVGGADMTTEAALTKLSYLLSQDLPRGEVERLLRTSLRGELTPADGASRFSVRERGFVASVARALAERGDAVVPAEVERALMPLVLCAAGAHGDVEALERLAAAGADLDAGDYDGRTALHLASAGGHLEAVEALLRRGARPGVTDRDATTPLHAAARHGHATVTARLLGAGADPHALTDEGRTALDEARRGGHTMVEALLTGR